MLSYVLKIAQMSFMNVCEFHTHSERDGIFLFTTVSQYNTSSFLCRINSLGVVPTELGLHWLACTTDHLTQTSDGIKKNYSFSYLVSYKH